MNIGKAVLMYFSPTGGTKQVAEMLAGRLGFETEELDITAGEPHRELQGDELAIFAVPSYGGRIPAPVHRRLEGIIGNGSPAVLLCVFGNRAVDDCYAELQDAVEKRGFVSVAGAEFIAPHSVDRSFGAGRPDASDEKIMDEFAAKLKEALNADKPRRLELPGKRPYQDYSGIPIKPSANAKKCVGCGKCVSHCPVGAIDPSHPEKTDKKLCISCMGCIAVCPAGARQIPALMRPAAKLFLKKACSQRQEPKYYI